VRARPASRQLPPHLSVEQVAPNLGLEDRRVEFERAGYLILDALHVYASHD